MPAPSGYSTYKRKFIFRFPAFYFVTTQIYFWMFATICLAVISHLVMLLTAGLFSQTLQVRLLPSTLLAAIFGFCYGLGFGLVDFYFDKFFLRRRALGVSILLKTLVSLTLFCLLFAAMRFFLFEFIMVNVEFSGSSPLNKESWKILFWLFLFFYFLMGLLINFINQVNKKFGPGVLLPLLLGKYRNPKEEERIFMFMDLKSSTMIAEKLGHLKYSSFIRDAFMDINQRLLEFNADVYQYVGDEIVLTWNLKEGLIDNSCVTFYFACQKQFEKRSEYYVKNYGQVPEFKAGLHLGKVTAVEIGEVKRDIAYHGDTLNTAARIQGMCNEHNKKFLVSEYLLTKIELPAEYEVESLGEIILKGKSTPVGIAGIVLRQKRIG